MSYELLRLIVTFSRYVEQGYHPTNTIKHTQQVLPSLDMLECELGRREDVKGSLHGSAQPSRLLVARSLDRNGRAASSQVA